LRRPVGIDAGRSAGYFRSRAQGDADFPVVALRYEYPERSQAARFGDGQSLNRY